MSIAQMALREILRRKMTFALATIAVALAVGTVLGVYASLETYSLRSDELLARKEAELNERLKVLQDEMRKATLKLSFNLAILPGDQDIKQWHATDCATTYIACITCRPSSVSEKDNASHWPELFSISRN